MRGGGSAAGMLPSVGLRYGEDSVAAVGSLRDVTESDAESGEVGAPCRRRGHCERGLFSLNFGHLGTGFLMRALVDIGEQFGRI